MDMTSLQSEQKTSLTPNYSIIFPFERNFDRCSTQEWMIKNWHHTFYYILLYIVVIFGGQVYMQSRSRFDLRRTLAAWNVFLAAFSVIGFCRSVPEFIHVLKEFGFTHSACIEPYRGDVNISGFWAFMFALSKLLELGDTVFIVLRKQKLIFLHWYHHITVLVFSWYMYTEDVGPGRWFVVMNFFVHSLMYSYYAMRAMGFKIPRPVSIFLTSLQILQMIVGFSVTFFAYNTRQKGQLCQLSDNIAYFMLFLLFSFFMLFAKFFYNSYIIQPGKSKKIH